MNIVLCVLGALMFIGAMYLLLRVKTTDWAREDRFFVSPAFGRIKARTRAGKIVEYIANLRGLDVHIDETTGNIEPGEEMITWSFWWKVFGVRFIGLDDVHEYAIEVTEIGRDGQVTITTRTAHSLHYSGSYPIIVEAAESIEGTKIGLRLRITLKTKHAGRCLKFKNNWISVAHSAVKAASRDFVGKNKVRDLLTMQNELHSAGKDGFVELIMSLNTSVSGNPGLIETLGQEIVAVNLESIEIEDGSVAKALLEQEIALENMAAEKARAEKQAEITVINAKVDAEKTVINAEAAAKQIVIDATAKAKSEKLKGQAVNSVIRQLAGILGKEGVVEYKEKEALAGLKDLKGTLIYGKSDKVPSMILPSTNFQKGD